MKDQHTIIKGYRDLSEGEIAQMNAIKAQGETLGAMILSLQSTASYDQRWVALAKTHLQQGIMAAVRAVAQPTTF